MMLMRYFFRMLWIATAFAFCGCRSHLHRNYNGGSDPLGALYITTLQKTSDIEFLNALSKLGPPLESPQHWVQIANDSNRSMVQRQKAIFQLFYRHVHVGITLKDFPALLAPATWLKEEDINQIKLVSGLVPIKLNFEDTAITIRVLGEKEKNQSVIYMRWSGKIPEDAIRRIIRGCSLASDDQYISSTLEEWAPNDLTYIDPR